MKLDDCFRKGFLKRIPPDMENARRSIELSASNIEDAEENLHIHRYRVVIVSSYTAMFHAARALLFKDGIKERSHECVPKYLKEKYKDMGMIQEKPLGGKTLYVIVLYLNDTFKCHNYVGMARRGQNR